MLTPPDALVQCLCCCKPPELSEGALQESLVLVDYVGYCRFGLAEKVKFSVKNSLAFKTKGSTHFAWLLDTLRGQGLRYRADNELTFFQRFKGIRGAITALVFLLHKCQTDVG